MYTNLKNPLTDPGIQAFAVSCPSQLEQVGMNDEGHLRHSCCGQSQEQIHLGGAEACWDDLQGFGVLGGIHLIHLKVDSRALVDHYVGHPDGNPAMGFGWTED